MPRSVRTDLDRLLDITGPGGVNERRGRGFFFPMLSMMDIILTRAEELAGRWATRLRSEDGDEMTCRQSCRELPGSRRLQ